MHVAVLRDSNGTALVPSEGTLVPDHACARGEVLDKVMRRSSLPCSVVRPFCRSLLDAACSRVSGCSLFAVFLDTGPEVSQQFVVQVTAP